MSAGAEKINENLNPQSPNLQSPETDTLRNALMAISDDGFDLKQIQQFVYGEY